MSIFTNRDMAKIVNRLRIQQDFLMDVCAWIVGMWNTLTRR